MTHLYAQDLKHIFGEDFVLCSNRVVLNKGTFVDDQRFKIRMVN